MTAVTGAATTPTIGICSAISATGSPSWPRNCAGSNSPIARMEKAMANRRTEITSPIDVRGMMVAGRRVSWATCEIVSSPTKAMMASEEPKANWLRVGRLNASWWATISGFQTSTKPATTMMLWAKIAIVPMISLKLVETLIPRTLSQTIVSMLSVNRRYPTATFSIRPSR